MGKRTAEGLEERATRTKCEISILTSQTAFLTMPLMLNTSTAQFWVYENWRAHGHKVTVHRGDCGHCNHGTGVHAASGTVARTFLLSGRSSKLGTDEERRRSFLQKLRASSAVAPRGPSRPSGRDGGRRGTEQRGRERAANLSGSVSASGERTERTGLLNAPTWAWLET